MTSWPTAFSLTRGDEVLDHRQRDVGFEQGHAHLAQGVGDVGLGQACFTAQRLHDAGKALGQVVEHWLAVLIYWLESFRSRMDGLQPMVLPLAAAGAAAPAIFPQLRVIGHAGGAGFLVHFLAAMLAYSLFTLSALHAVFMGFAERKLHQRSMTRSLGSLPPILTMEALLFRMITVAFCLLTVALVSGVWFSEEIFGKAAALDHKTLFAFASWAIFAALLVGRRVYGWRGRIAMRWTLAGFMVLLLAYIGSRFVVEVVLGRI
jgi:ABC-type uncharacterized transport system permease subunit